MGAVKKGRSRTTKSKRPPAKTVEQREAQMISLAVDLAEQKLEDGSASSMVIVHYLKLGTTRERLEKEKLKHENELLEAKAEALKSQKRVEELYKEALEAMRRYSGSGTGGDDIDDD